MSTYPIPSAHLIGYLLHRRFDLPWVAEFRDPMLQRTYPANAWERWAYSRVERLVFGNAAQVVVTADGCRQMYLDRFPDFDRESICTISNGYDPIVFEGASTSIDSHRSNKVILLHSGLLYPHERNPTAFFRAVRSLSQKNILEDWNIEFRFRASGNEDSYQEIIRELEIDPYVSFCPRLPYAEAVQEMQSVDALMIFQADNCNFQIPAKIYEYLYCRKPIIGLTDPCGDTGKLLQGLGIRSIAKLEDSDQIERALYDFLHDLHTGDMYTVPMTDVEKFSRESLTKVLGRVLTRAACSR
jgi:glycosyltransferase involved in cell wall biosynthesis